VHIMLICIFYHYTALLLCCKWDVCVCVCDSTTLKMQMDSVPDLSNLNSWRGLWRPRMSFLGVSDFLTIHFHTCICHIYTGLNCCMASKFVLWKVFLSSLIFLPHRWLGSE